MKISDILVRGGNSSNLALVEVVSDDGLRGIGGTSAPAPVISAIIRQEHHGLLSVLRGQDPLRLEARWRQMFHGWQSRRGRGSEGGLAVNAMAAIDMALWDLAGKARGLAVHEMLGGAIRDEVAVYASTTAFDMNSVQRGGPWERKAAETLAAECRAHVADGFRALKVAWGNHFSAADIERLAAVREAVGSDVLLALDFGCPAYWSPGWTVAAAIRAARILEKYDIYFWEEPLPPHDFSGFAELAAATPIHIATGESLTLSHDFERLIRSGIDVVQPDAAQMGITQFHAVSRCAEQNGVLVIPHGPWPGLTIASHLQALVCGANGVLIEYPGWRTWPQDCAAFRITKLAHEHIVEHPLTMCDGALRLPGRPGLGLGEFIPEAIDELESLISETGKR